MKRLHRNHTCNPISAWELRGYNRLLEAIHSVPTLDLSQYEVEPVPFLTPSMMYMVEEDSAKWN